MNTFEIVSLVLNVLFIGGGLVTLITLRPTRKKANSEAKDSEAKAKGTELENDEKAAQIVMSYIVEPLKKEINALRKDVRNLQKAIDKVSDCPYSDTCPVKHELQNDKDSERGETESKI